SYLQLFIDIDTSVIYPLSLHDALPILAPVDLVFALAVLGRRWLDAAAYDAPSGGDSGGVGVARGGGSSMIRVPHTRRFHSGNASGPTFASRASYPLAGLDRPTPTNFNNRRR